MLMIGDIVGLPYPQVQEAQDSIPDLIRTRTQESSARKAQEAASRAAFEARRDETLKAAREQLRRESDVLRAQLSQVWYLPLGSTNLRDGVEKTDPRCYSLPASWVC
jgi:hypothetical protein